MRIKWAIIILFIGTTSCKTKVTTTTTEKIQLEQEFRHTTEVHTLGTSTKTIIPCKEANQEIQAGNTKVVFKTIRDTLRVFIETAPTLTQKDSIHTAKDLKITSDKYEKVTVYRIPKWTWFTMAGLLALVLWAYRRIILTVL